MNKAILTTIFISLLSFGFSSNASEFSDNYDETLIKNFAKSVTEISRVMDKYRMMKQNNDSEKIYTREEIKVKIQSEVSKILKNNNLSKEQYNNIIEDANKDENLRQYIIEMKLDLFDDKPL